MRESRRRQFEVDLSGAKSLRGPSIEREVVE
jgi:hypothetical protein